MRILRIILITLVLACPCLARTIIVDDNGPADYNNIQAAIDSAVNGDTVLIQPGIYTGIGNRDISILNKSIVVTGTSPNDPNIVASTVVDGGGIAAGSYQGFIFRGSVNNSTLRGITIANFYVLDKSGGGIYCNNASPTIDKCVLRNNQCDLYTQQIDVYGGGGFGLNRGSAKFTNCAIKGNNCNGGGGGGSCVLASPSFTGCVFEDNNSSGAGGLGIHYGKVTLDNCAFVNNRARSGSDGSALHLLVEGADNVVRYCLFTGNKGSSSVVANVECSPTYDTCIFVGNTFESHGAITNWGSSPVFKNCTIANNISQSLYAGGMHNVMSNPIVSNCILWGNSPTDMYNNSSSPQISYTCMGTWPGPIPAGGNFKADPLFVNMAAGDLHLRLNSPCIDAGNPNIRYSGQKDFDGQPRVMGSRIDMGPYEFRIPPKTIYVDADATGANNGTSWANAYRYLQDALYSLYPGDKIRVAEGIYKPDRGAHTTLWDKSATFRLSGLGISMEGGYAGVGSPNPNKRDPALYKTILSGDLAGNDVTSITTTQLLTSPSRAENSNNIITSYWVDANTILDGFIIEKGSANTDGTIYNGGGLYNSDSSPIIKNCIFRLNAARRLGGAVYNTSSSNTKFLNCIFTGNYALNSGGGLYFEYSNPELINCDVFGNYANTCGGVYCNATGLNMKNCMLWGNSDQTGITEASQIKVITGTPVINYCCINSWSGAIGGTGNFSADPLFVDYNNIDAAKWDLHLLPDSLCIDAGDPNSPWDLEPWPNGARINIGSYGNTTQATQSRDGLQFAGFNIINKTRLGRTLYRYVLSISLTNITASDMTNVYVNLIDASEQVTNVIDGNIFFPQISAGSIVNSNDVSDYFTIDVNRANLIIPGRLTWQVDYARSGISHMQLMSADFLNEGGSVPGDINGDKTVDFFDIKILAEQWLLPPGDPSADIAPQPSGDGIVNWLDFAEFANYWPQPVVESY
jgi:hypothetical protein